MLTTSQIRSEFLSYFKNNDHQILKSSSLVPHNDPSLIFTNAGMVQFKDIFTQNKKAKYKKVATSQKCIRAGGKHNDLDNVGYTARHHTFFEMLGNFSFGDYFKEEAIFYAWNFLTKVIKLNKDRLLITVYHEDTQAFDLWKKITSFPDSKIIKIKTNDNFWSMGNTGPCGPCSEIFYDHGPEVDGGPPGSLNENGDRFTEIWNIVFMQYEMLNNGKRIDLPKPCIDTGMGLERISAVLQNKINNFEIDIFKNLIDKSRDIIGNHDINKNIISYRIIADHIRSICFLISDGILPNNEGRGYVLRRIMRRAIRYAKTLHSKEEAILYKIAPFFTEEMSDAYPELEKAKPLITETLKLEEEKFSETLNKGLRLLNTETKTLKKGEILSGDIAFKLYDTYGFPYDLTEDIMRSREIKIDRINFEKLLEGQKNRARKSWKGSGEEVTENIWHDIKKRIDSTEFQGFTNHQLESKIICLLKNGIEVKQASEGEEIAIILDKTPFYGESGGQEGDKGLIETDNALTEIYDTKKYLGTLNVSYGKIKKGQLTVNESCKSSIDSLRRNNIKSNHTATHLLHESLRRILGKHVTQKGSLVAEDKLRFDINHAKPITPEEINKIELIVNHIITKNLKVESGTMNLEDAISSGATALFGEKYDSKVRVLSIPDPKNSNNYFSQELCGGTHVNRTGDIGLFKIISENSVSSGIRRIEALTGELALLHTQNERKNISEACQNLKTSPELLNERILLLLNTSKKLEKDIAKLQKNIACSGNNDKSYEEKIKDILFVGKFLENLPPKELTTIANDFLKKIKSGVVVISSLFEGKGSVLVMVSSDLTDRINATNLIKICSEDIGAKGGGGKADFARTGTSEGEKVKKAIPIIKSHLENTL